MTAVHSNQDRMKYNTTNYQLSSHYQFFSFDKLFYENKQSIRHKKSSLLHIINDEQV